MGWAESSEKGPWSPARDYRRLSACQSEWIGFKASCCDSWAAAVPIGCNHRLCPLCNAARLEHFRQPAREILGAMANPTFLTLTIPNTWNLSAQTFKQIRGWWKAFFRSNKSLLQGGIYTLEVSYNRDNGSWHPHLHIVFDAPWPTSGIAHSKFVRLKRLLEFSWLRTTSSEARRTYRRNEFERWIKESAQHVRAAITTNVFDVSSIRGR